MENKHLQVVKFEVEGKAYPMSIHDVDGNRWIISQEVGSALGTTRIRGLVSELTASREIKEGRHYRTLTVQMPEDSQARRHLALSYRGIIRVAMRSEGKRAAAFRDWAEDVLYEVMTTGCYVGAEAKATPIAIIEERARAEGVRRGLGLQMLRERYNLSTEELVDYCWYRYVGLTQVQTAKLMDVSKEKLQAASKMLDEIGVQLPEAIPGNKIGKAKQRLFYRLIGIGSVEDDFLPIHQEVVNG